MTTRVKTAREIALANMMYGRGYYLTAPMIRKILDTIEEADREEVPVDKINWTEILADGETHHVALVDGVVYIDGAEQGTPL